MRIVAVPISRPLVSQRRIGIAELYHQPFHQTAESRDDLAPASCRHGSEDFRLHLQIPGVVELAGLQDGAGCRNGIPSPL